MAYCLRKEFKYTTKFQNVFYQFVPMLLFRDMCCSRGQFLWGRKKSDITFKVCLRNNLKKKRKLFLSQKFYRKYHRFPSPYSHKSVIVISHRNSYSINMIILDRHMEKLNYDTYCLHQSRIIYWVSHKYCAKLLEEIQHIIRIKIKKATHDCKRHFNPLWAMPFLRFLTIRSSL